MYYCLSYPENIEIEKKLNLFLDYFRFVSLHIGLIDDLPLENHLSLVEKIIFQIEHNPNHRVKYITNYLANPLFKDRFIKSLSPDAFEDLDKLIKCYNQSSNKNDFIENKPKFKEAFEVLRGVLFDKAFKQSLDTIVEEVCSCYPVSCFIDKISYHVKLLVSEFLFTHRSRSDTANVLEWIRGPNRFPYPADIATRGKEERREYFVKLPLRDRLRAINEIYSRKQYAHTFVCKVYDMGSHPEFEFEYRKVTFRSKEKSSEIINGVSDWDKECVRSFLFDAKEFILAYLRISYYSFYGSVAKLTAIDTIREELSYINTTLGTNGVVDVRDYLLVDAGGKTQGSGSSNSKKIDANSVSILENSSAYKHVSERDNTAKQHILNHEPYLSAAILSKRVADYWHYLETIIANAFPGDKKKVENFLPSLLLVNHLSQQKNLTGKYIGTAFEHLSVHPECLGLIPEKRIALRKKESLSVDELLIEIDNPFVDELVKRYIEKDHADYSVLKEYYRSTLTEAYEQRNAYQHAGYECEKAVIKLNYTLHRLVIRFRWLILERAEVPGEISFGDILRQLKEEGEKLCAP